VKLRVNVRGSSLLPGPSLERELEWSDQVRIAGLGTTQGAVDLLLKPLR